MTKHEIARVICSVVAGFIICYFLLQAIKWLQFFGYMEWLNLSYYGL